MMKTAGLLLVASVALASAFENVVYQGDDTTGEHWVFYSKRQNETFKDSSMFAHQQAFPRFGDPSNNMRNLSNFKQGRMIYIYGNAPRRGTFDIDLIPIYDTPSTDICLRITVDIDTYHVTRDSRIHDKWVYPEGGDDTYAGILPRRPFVFYIAVQSYGYEIAIEGYHFATFYHRIAFTKEMKISVSDYILLDYIEYY